MAALAIPAAIQAGTSIIGTLLGRSAAAKAAANYNRVAQAAGSAMSNATNTATGGINQAVGTGQEQIGTGVNQANQTLADRYNSLTRGYNDVTGNVNDIYAGANANVNPYIAAGNTGLSQLAAAVAPGGALTQQFGFDPSRIYQDPAYQFNLQQGTQAVNRAAAARGAGGGAGTGKALAQFTSGLAANQYQNAFANQLNTYNTNRQNLLQSLNMQLGQGQFGTGLGAQLGVSQANQLGNLATAFGGLQNQITLPMAGYSYGGGLAGAQLGLQGAESAGQLGIQGANAANNFYMQGAGAQAGGTLNQGMQGQNMVNSLGSLASSLPWGQWFPSGGYPTGPWAPGAMGPWQGPVITG